MTSYEVMELFADQLRRLSDGTTYKTKVVVTPSSVNEAGLVIKLSLVKTKLGRLAENKGPMLNPTLKFRTVRMRLAVSGTAESMTGLKQACEAIEALDEFFIQPSLRLERIVESENGMTSVAKIPNTAIYQTVTEEDSFVANPDSTEVQDVEDVRIVNIIVPAGGAND